MTRVDNPIMIFFLILPVSFHMPPILKLDFFFTLLYQYILEYIDFFFLSSFVHILQAIFKINQYSLWSFVIYFRLHFCTLQLYTVAVT